MQTFLIISMFITIIDWLLYYVYANNSDKCVDTRLDALIVIFVCTIPLFNIALLFLLLAEIENVKSWWTQPIAKKKVKK